MPPTFRTIVEEARLAAQAVVDYAGSLVDPTVRLGVTGLTRAGKTVFITALIHNLLQRRAAAGVRGAGDSGRIARARLEPQPDDAVPRFDYETHVHALIEERRWPESTRRISELRLVIDYQSASGRDAARSPSTSSTIRASGCSICRCSAQSYAEWSAETLLLSRQEPRATLPRPGTRISRHCGPRAPRTSRRRSKRRGCSPTICGPAATSATR